MGVELDIIYMTNEDNVDLDFQALHQLDEKVSDSYLQYINKFKALKETRNHLECKIFSPEILKSIGKLSEIEQYSQLLFTDSHLNDSTPLSTLNDIFKNQSTLLENLQLIYKYVAEPLPYFEPYRLAESFFNIQGLKELNSLYELITTTPIELLGLRDDLFKEDLLDEILPDLKSQLEKIEGLKKISNDIYRLDELPPVDRLFEIQTDFVDTSVFRFFKLKWWKARSNILGIAKHEQKSNSLQKDNFALLFQYHLLKETFENSSQYKTYLKHHFF
jgi:hypothetical protein